MYPPRLWRHHHHLRPKRDGFFDVVSHDQHRRLRRFPERKKMVMKAGPRERIERREWLIKEEHLRTRDKSARDGDALLLPAGQARAEDD